MVRILERPTVSGLGRCLNLTSHLISWLTLPSANGAGVRPDLLGLLPFNGYLVCSVSCSGVVRNVSAAVLQSFFLSIEKLLLLGL
jgi:hypothetical protein